MRRELVAIVYAESGQVASAGAGTKQLVVLATDLLCQEVALDGRVPAALAEHLIAERILPVCYRGRYDRRFLEALYNTLELTRNSLVGDLPSAGNTLGELACHAILDRASEILGSGPQGLEDAATAIDPGLPELLADRATELADGLSHLRSVVLEDTDVLYLFELPPDAEPADHLQLPGATSDPTLLAFENWLRPFGNVPRPQITYDGRAWAA